VRSEDIYAFILFVGNERQNGWASRSRKLSSIKALYRYLSVKKHSIEKNPTADIDSPKRRTTLPKYLSLEESTELLRAVKDDTDSKHTTRDYAILVLFLNCGMRLSELVGINLTDFDREMRTLRIRGKGAKERMVYLNDACRRAVVEYISERQLTDPDNVTTTALFLGRAGARISNKTVQWIVYKYLDRAGLGGRGFSAHKLRHTAATLMYRNGHVDVRVLKDILGHEQLNTTQIYTHVSDEGMAAAADSNPLAKFNPDKK
jgi:site-specific recombinase XerD